MPKKYLLYIHSVQFEDEQKKSELVNKLLEKHYYNFAEVNKILNDAPVPTSGRVVMDGKGNVYTTPKHVYTPSTKFCKHGNPIGQCFDKKADRSCKP